MRVLPPQGEALIKSFEGIADGDPKTVNLDPYMDLSGWWTIGWGHLVRYRGRALREEADRALAFSLYRGGITMAQAQTIFTADTIDACAAVSADVAVPLTDNQFSAVSSFTFNEGRGNFDSSTLRRLLNAGNYAAAALEFPKWNRSNGVVVAGLTRRRLAEQALFTK